MSDTLNQTRAPQSPGAKVDTILLALLILLMCSQLTNLQIGVNAYDQGKGFATKPLFIAISDVFLLGIFAWFCLRTTLLRAWKQVWCPPFACWALIIAMIIAALHSPTLIDATLKHLSGVHGLKKILKTLMSQEAKESKEAIAELLQFTSYFLIAPLVFVNLMHDRRSGELISRRKVALHAFSGAVVLTALIAFVELLTGHESPAPNALFGTPNAYAAFLALALPLSVANILHTWNKPLPPLIATLAALALALLTTVSLWATLAIFIGIATAALLQKQTSRGAIVGAIALVVCLVAWNLPGTPQLIRRDFLTPYGDQEVLKVYGAAAHGASAPKPGDKPNVKKQYIEWYAAMGWSLTNRAMPGSETGERFKTFATGVGPGNYQNNIGTYYDSLPNEEKMPPDSNNLYLVQAVSIGALGLGAIVWMMAHFAGLAWQARKRDPHDWLPSGVLAALLSVAFVNLFHAMFVRGTGLVLAFVFSLAVIALLDGETQHTPDADV